MNRKNTILLAVFINAAMLIVLFAMALTTQEEIALAPTHEMSRAAQTQQNPAPPMFGDELDFILRSQTPQAKPLAEVLPQVQLSDSWSGKSEGPAIVHSLPPIHPTVPESTSSTLAQPPKFPESYGATSAQETCVKSGDTLEKIARAYRTTVDEIIKLNHLPSSFLRVGQVLKLPAEKIAAKPSKPVALEKPTSSGPDYYTVKVGDNPWMIAVKHHLKVDELLKLNGLNEEKARKLKPGDRLRIK